MTSIKGGYCPSAGSLVCIVWFSIIDDRIFIASDKWMQKYAGALFCVVCTFPIFKIPF